MKESRRPARTSSCDETNSSHEYDVIIVGAGPSAIGLLYGLLEPYATSTSASASASTTTNENDASTNVNVKVPPFTIALMERGSENNADAPPETRKESNPILDNPKRWMEASHASPQSSIVYHSTPQTNLRNRILSIPTGQGLGGSTNINACWVHEPLEDDFDDWPEYYSAAAAAATTTQMNKGQPRNNRMMWGIRKMKSVMRQNGALVVDSKLVLDDVNGTGELEIDGASVGTDGVEDDDGCENACEATTLGWNRTTNAVGKDHQKRVNYFHAILAPLLKQNPELERVVTIYSGVQVERISTKASKTTNGTTSFLATGVDCSCTVPNSPFYRHDTKYFSVHARQKVILCAGAILSPALLIASGIGAPKELKEIGITPILNSSDEQENESVKQNEVWNGIGKQLKDHFIVVKAFLILPTFWKTFQSVSSVRGWISVDVPCEEKDGEKKQDIIVKSEQKKVTKNKSARCILAVSDGEIAPEVICEILLSKGRRHNNGKKPFLEALRDWFFYFFHVVVPILLRATPFLQSIAKQFTAVISVCLLNPESCGCVMLRRKGNVETIDDINSSSTVDRITDFDILVDPGYLTDGRDLTKLEYCFRLSEAVSNKWFSKCLEVLPGKAYTYMHEDNYLKEFAADFGLPFFHWTGTCSMGKAGEASSIGNVVSSELKVRRFENLHVCDASVFPSLTSGPTALTCVSLGYVSSSLIAKDLVGKKENE